MISVAQCQKFIQGVWDYLDSPLTSHGALTAHIPGRDCFEAGTPVEQQREVVEAANFAFDRADFCIAVQPPAGIACARFALRGDTIALECNDFPLLRSKRKDVEAAIPEVVSEVNTIHATQVMSLGETKGYPKA